MVRRLKSLIAEDSAMGINENDQTIYPYTVGREDCKVLPRSFKTLVEAKAYLAEQDARALERSEYYLDGPEPDGCSETWVSSDHEVIGVA
jgi:hypothetical protein